MHRSKAVFCWSGGKDSAFALYLAMLEGRFEIVSLLSTLNEHHHRISMHGVREALLDKQAAAMDLQLEKVWVREGTNQEYERSMEEKLLSFKKEGVSHILFGDIFLEDLRAYRENNLKRIGLEAVFPIWKRNTTQLVHEFLQDGFETLTCCISTQFLDERFLGRKIDLAFLGALPSQVDPCGENGEFHSFCYKGPLFKREILFTTGEKIFKPVAEFGMKATHGFWFIDLVPV
jgi:uncharacterized protein (TIGR00290 family)